MLGVSAGGLYLFVALLVGKMLVFGPTGTRDLSLVYLASGVPWWDFPILIVIAPNALLSLPLLVTVAMVAVATGIGLGMGVSIRLAVLLFRWRRRRAASSATVGSVAGLTPALLALLTLGACCSTTAATTASIGVIAEATGSSTDILLANAWFLSVFQVVILWVTLVAQDRLVVVYSALIGPSDADASGSSSAPRTGRGPGWTAIRALWLAGAVLWALTPVALAGTFAAASSPGVVGIGWLLGFEAPAVAVIAYALFGSADAGGNGRARDAARTRAFRILAGALAIGMPAILLLLGGSGVLGADGSAIGIARGLAILLVVESGLLAIVVGAIARAPDPQGETARAVSVGPGTEGAGTPARGDGGRSAGSTAP